MDNVSERSPFSNIFQVGLMVRDIDKAIEYYQSLGMGPFQILSLGTRERFMFGKLTNDVRPKVMAAQLGQVQLKLVEPAGGVSLWKEALDTRGEGIHHISFVVNDIDKETVKLVEKGLKIIAEGRFLNGGGYTYFDTAGVGGVVLELIQWPSE